MAEVTFQQKHTYQEMREAEIGLARALGMGEPTQSLVNSLIMRPLIGLFSRVQTKTTVNEDGVTVDQAGSVKAFPWRDFGMTFETADYLAVVLQTTTAPIMFSKHVISDQDLTVIRRLIADHLIATPESTARIRSLRGG